MRCAAQTGEQVCELLALVGREDREFRGVQRGHLGEIRVDHRLGRVGQFDECCDVEFGIDNLALERTMAGRADRTARDGARRCAELSRKQVRSKQTARALAGTSSLTRTQLGQESEIRLAASATMR